MERRRQYLQNQVAAKAEPATCCDDHAEPAEAAPKRKRLAALPVVSG